MNQRSISFNEIEEIKENLRVIEEYPEENSYPSCLILGFTKSKRPVHIVFSINDVARIVFIITVYEPSAKKWNKNFSRRKK